ncbi:MAG: helix-turn-helix transcriptional regulator [Candidatus Nanopelagicales bacterium]|nr:helix-turn-helix transcriptional regulator [Candidatus Nanopelagicales bacterium]
MRVGADVWSASLELEPDGRRSISPIVARSRTAYRSMGPVAYDCVTVIVIREGSAILFGESGQKPVKQGDVIALAANTLWGSEPEGHITATVVYVDPDYVLDQLRWQYADVMEDRLAAQGLADAIFAEPAQILHIGEDRAEMLSPWLDELVSLSIEGNLTRDFFRVQALWFQVVHVIEPFFSLSPARASLSQRRHTRPVLPRGRRFAPLRAEARHAASLLRSELASRWTLDTLAREVHMSPSHLSRVFVEAYGKTPLAFLTMLRAERLARLLRETDLPVAAAMREVGWHSRSHASRLFREYVGVTPGRYRQMRVGMP